MITLHTGRAENPLVFKSVRLGCSAASLSESEAKET
jgi:hypothetical protein